MSDETDVVPQSLPFDGSGPVGEVCLPLPRYIPFVHLLGMKLHRAEAGESELSLSQREELCNSMRVMHGGVVMTLLDVAQAIAGTSLLQGTPQDGMVMVTIEMKTSFMRPSTGDLRVKGKVLHRTATMAFTEAQVFAANGQLCAHATGTFKYVRGVADSERRVTGAHAAGPANPAGTDG